MASYKCRVSFGGVTDRVFADTDTDEREIERAVKDDLESHYRDRPDDLERDMRLSVDCSLSDESAEPGEFDEEVSPGIWVQR